MRMKRTSSGSLHNVFDSGTMGAEKRLRHLDSCGVRGLMTPEPGSTTSDGEDSSECGEDDRHHGLLLPLSQAAVQTDAYRSFVGRSSEMNLIRTALNRKPNAGSNWIGHRSVYQPPDVSKLWPVSPTPLLVKYATCSSFPCCSFPVGTGPFPELEPPYS